MTTTTIKKKKKCVKGFECGYTCIKQGLKCAEAKQAEAKKYLEELERNIKDTFSAEDPEVTPEVTPLKSFARMSKLYETLLNEGASKEEILERLKKLYEENPERSDGLNLVELKTLGDLFGVKTFGKSKLQILQAISEIVPEITPEVVDTPTEVTYKDLMAKGKAFVEDLDLGDYESADAYEIILLGEEIDALRDQSISELSPSNTLGMKNKNLKALSEKRKELETRYRATLEDIEDKLILGLRKTVGLTSRGAENSLDKLDFKIPQDSIDPIKSIMLDFIQLVGTNALGTLDTIISEKERAYASAVTRLIDVGRSTNATILFHEMAHHFETSNPGLAEAAQGWLKSRATSETPELLSKLTGVEEYDDDDERAYPDNFITPYVGKFYYWGATEVYSVGLERFSDSGGLLDFLRKDPEHAMLIIGAILHANKK